MERTIEVGDKRLTLPCLDGKTLRIVVSGHDWEGMYGSEGISLNPEKSLEFFENLCEVMPGAVR